MANYTNVIASNICDAAGNKLASGTVSFQATDAANQPLNFQVGGGGQVVTTPATAAITAGVIAGGFQVADSANTSPAGILYRITITDTILNRVVVTYSLVTVTGTTFSLDTFSQSGAAVLPPVGGSVNGPLTVTGDLNVTGSFNPGTLGNITSTGTILAKRIEGVRYADQFSGATVTNQIDAAIADCGSTRSIVVVPASMGSGSPTSLPANVSVWDQRTPFMLKLLSGGSLNNQLIGLDIEQQINPTSDAAYSNFGQTTESFTPTTNIKNFTGAQYGVYGSFSHFGGGTLGSGFGGAFESFNPGSSTPTLLVGVSGTANNGGVAAGDPAQTPTNNGSATNLRGIDGIAKNLASGIVTNAAALYAEGAINSGGGSITNSYGLLIADQTVAANNWAIFTGLGKVQFSDNVFAAKRLGVGADTNASVGLFLQPAAGSLTGTTQFGLRALPVMGSAATVFGIGIYGRADTQAAAFTQTENASLYAANASKGASSTITTAYGVYVESITAGSNNFAIKTLGTAISEFGGGVRTGSGGTAVTQIKVYSQSLTPSAVSAASSVEQTFTVTGVTTADKIIFNPPAQTNSAIPVYAYVSAADTIKIGFINPTAGSLTPVSGVYLLLAVRS